MAAFRHVGFVIRLFRSFTKNTVLFGLYRCVKFCWNRRIRFNNMPVLMFLRVWLNYTYSRPLLGFWASKWGGISTKPPKGTFLRGKTSYQPMVRPVRVTKRPRKKDKEKPYRGRLSIRPAPDHPHRAIEVKFCVGVVFGGSSKGSTFIDIGQVVSEMWGGGRNLPSVIAFGRWLIGLLTYKPWYMTTVGCFVLHRSCPWIALIACQSVSRAIAQLQCEYR